MSKTKTKPKVRPVYYYTVLVQYKGYDQRLDAKLEKAVGQHAGTGYCLMDSTRDVDWKFKSRAKAMAAANKLKRFRSLLSIEFAAWRSDLVNPIDEVKIK